jgi:hypothetical protein
MASSISVAPMETTYFSALTQALQPKSFVKAVKFLNIAMCGVIAVGALSCAELRVNEVFFDFLIHSLQVKALMSPCHPLFKDMAFITNGGRILQLTYITSLNTSVIPYEVNLMDQVIHIANIGALVFSQKV